MVETVTYSSCGVNDGVRRQRPDLPDFDAPIPSACARFGLQWPVGREKIPN